MTPPIIDAATRQHTLTELEVLRKEIYGIKIKNYSIIGLSALILILGILFVGLIPVIILGIAGLIYGIVMISKAGAKEAQYRYSYKHSLLAYALKNIDTSLQIHDIQALSEEEFISSQLFAKEPDRYHSEDQIYGCSGKTRFSFSEVHAEYKTVSQTKNGQREDWYDILKGWFSSLILTRILRGQQLSGLKILVLHLVHGSQLRFLYSVLERLSNWKIQISIRISLLIPTIRLRHVIS